MSGSPYRETPIELPTKPSRQDRYAIALRQIRRAMKRPSLTKLEFERLRRLEARAKKLSMTDLLPNGPYRGLVACDRSPGQLRKRRRP